MINPCCTETSCCKSTNGDLQRARQLIGIESQVGEGGGALATYHLFLALSAVLVIYGQVLLGKTSMKKKKRFISGPQFEQLGPFFGLREYSQKKGLQKCWEGREIY